MIAFNGPRGLSATGLVLLLATTMSLHGCVVFLTSVATVVRMKSSNHYTTTVLVKKPPAAVYAAMEQILERRPDVDVVRRDADAYLIEVVREEANATAKATDYGSGLTQLTVTADAGEGDRTDEDLALDVTRQICDELGVDYKVLDA